jgi:hypothetical protein
MIRSGAMMWSRTRRLPASEVPARALYTGLGVGAICLLASFLLLMSLSLNVGFLELLGDSRSENWRVGIIFAISGVISFLAAWTTALSILRLGQKSSRPK